MDDLIDFSEALTHLRSGERIARRGWNGKDMWLILVGGLWRAWDERTDNLRRLPWIGMKTADNAFVPWLASQTDILATDWVVLD